MFFGNGPVTCGQDKEKELVQIDEQIAAIMGLKAAIDNMMKAFGNHIVLEADLVRAYAGAIISLQELEARRAKLIKEIERGDPDKEPDPNTVCITRDEYQKLIDIRNEWATSDNSKKMVESERHA